jgi:hypothetical protein
MYRFSRSIYRELAPRIDASDYTDSSTARHRVLEACEATMRRMAYDRRYFARPAKTLFSEIRDEFALADQVQVYMVIDRYVNLALEHLEQMPDDISLDGRPRACHASTRQGTPCQREPLPGRDYCPSHKHLEEPADDVVEASEELGVAA